MNDQWKGNKEGEIRDWMVRNLEEQEKQTFLSFLFSVFLCDLKRKNCWFKALFSISLIHTKNSSALRIPPLEAIWLYISPFLQKWEMGEIQIWSKKEGLILRKWNNWSGRTTNVQKMENLKKFNVLLDECFGRQ